MYILNMNVSDNVKLVFLNKFCYLQLKKKKKKNEI